jgi:hypothetical protein
LRPAQTNSDLDPISKITKAKWTAGSNSRAPSMKAQSPEFKPQSHKITKKKDSRMDTEET